MSRLIKVGSRESKLAMVQTEWVIREVRKKHPELEFEIIGIKTMGDAILDKTLDKIGGKGLFIKELENALMEGIVDIAVHSMKDMPAEIPEALTIAAMSGREDPRDVLVTTDGTRFDQLPKGALIGTSSMRREVQAAAVREDLRFKTLRGNVLTRLNKLVNKEYDGILLAAAGLKRLGLEEKCSEYFGVDMIIPAVGQGVLGVEARKGDDVQYLLDTVHCPEAALAVEAERAFMIKLNGSCSIPIAAHAVVSGDEMTVFGMLALEDKSKVARAVVRGSTREAAKLGGELALLVASELNG